VKSVPRDIGGSSEGEGSSVPVVNAHVHLPPNFSAFETVAEAVARAAAEGAVALGSSNYHDFHVYREFRAAAEKAGIVPLFGLEIITVIEELRAEGILVNDPGNPGRTYLCGKGIVGFDSPNATAAGLMAAMRGASEERIRQMIAGLEAASTAAGLTTHLTDGAIAQDVAKRAAVPVEWVSLQERHVARAFQEAFFRGMPVAARPAFFERLYGAPPKADAADAAAAQDEIRSRLMKAGKSAFVPEATVSFEDAYRLILELGGIPCYPTLADGATPICGFEDPPEALVDRLLKRRVYFAELIPGRNKPQVVDRYVAAYHRAGIVVTGGTEHNTMRMIPVRPSCVGGEPLSAASERAMWEGVCIIAAHQHLAAQGLPGYVDGAGNLNDRFVDFEERTRWFVRLGESLIGTGSRAG
jgi:hypothetical protein